MIVFLDSFDHYTTLSQKWDASEGATISTTAKRTGLNGLSFSGGGFNSVSKNIGGTRTTVFAGCAIRFPTALPASTIALIRLMEGATVHTNVRVTAAGKLQITRNGTQLGADSTSTISAGQWYFLEFTSLISDTVGTAEVKVNGVSFLSLTGQDTRNGGTGIIDRVNFTADTNSMYVDDLYITDTTGSANTSFLGDVKVEALLVSGAGASAQWTPLSSTNASNVDENPPDEDTTYNSSSTVAQKDTFAMTDLATTGGTIKGVQVGIRARKDDAGVRTLRSIVRHSTSEAQSADMTMGTSYAYFFSIHEINPSTSVAWTGSEINAMEAGYIVQA